MVIERSYDNDYSVEEIPMDYRESIKE